MAETTHVGKKISRIRELRGMKQETLAEQLGISQQAVSKIEQSEHVDDLMLDRIAKALGVTGGTIRSFSEEAAIFNIQNNYEGSVLNNSSNQNYQCTFNPLDKYIEAVDEIRKLNEKNEKLYEALLKSERERIVLLERLLGEKG